MTDERWIPLDYTLTDGNHIRSLYVRGAKWQLYTTAEDGLAIAVNKSLYDWWITQGWIEEGLLEEVKATEDTVFVLCSRAGNMLSSLDYGPYPRNRQQALDYIRSLHRTLDRIGETRINHGIYVANFSLILPVDSDEEQINVGRVAGRFLTGGVDVPLGNVELVLQYAPYLTESDLNRMLDILQLSRDEGGVGVLHEGVSEKAIGKRPKARTERKNEPFSLPGRPELERFFREEIIDVVDHEEAYRKMGVGFPGGTVLYGPPGCGKTYAVEQLTEYLGWPVYTIDSGNIGSKYVHETARKVAEIFDEAAQNAPAIIVIDEMEAFLSGREYGMGSREVHMEEVAEFLRKIPEAPERKVLVFGMTNLLDSIDKAILRRGRFDYMIEAGMPSEEEIISLLESLLKDRPTVPKLPLSRISRKLSGYPISDVAFLVRDAARRTVREGKEAIDEDVLMAAFEALPPPEGKKRIMGFDMS